MKKLRQAVEEVDDLRDEEEEKRLAEMAQDGDDRKRHTAVKGKRYIFRR